MKKITNCYLCGNSNFRKRDGAVRDAPDLDIYECECGLVFLSSFEHINDNFYEESGMHEDSIDIDSWLSKTAIDDQRRFEYLKKSLPNKSLMDFGCGAGGFLLKSKELASYACGVELEKRLQSHFEENNLVVYSEVPDQSNNYDIITAFHVLEHLVDPKNILSKLADLLTKKGEIIIEVPSADDALLTLYNCKSFSEFTYWSCHLYLFTEKTLKTLFSQIGLKVNYIKQIQRYPLSNHLHWLSKDKPGGHEKWDFIDSYKLNSAYEIQLAAIGKCDTLIASISNY